MATQFAEPSFLVHAGSAEPMDAEDTENDIENEDEIDQLDSDSEEEVDQLSGPGKKSRKASPVHRKPGTSLLPTQRLESMLTAEGVMGSLSMSREATFILSVAVEEFIKRMAQAGQRHATSDGRGIVNYRDMASTTEQYQEFMFLKDTIPQPVSVVEALRRREEKEKELLEEDAAMGHSNNLSTCASFKLSSAGSIYVNSKSKSKTRVTNGKEKMNGSPSSSKRDPKGRWSHAGDIEGETIESSRIESISTGRPRRESRPPRRDIDSISTHSQRVPKTDKSAVSSGGSHGQEATVDHYSGYIPTMFSNMPPPTNQMAEEPNSRFYNIPGSSYISPTEDWRSTTFTGPASGFLTSTFSHAPPQNQGRTIYSQRYDPADRTSRRDELPPPMQHYRPDPKAPEQ